MPVKTLGKLTRGALGSQEFMVFDFSGGLNVKDPPQLVRDNDLTVAYNGYLSPNGGFQMRNGIASTGPRIPDAQWVVNARFYQAVRNGVAITPYAQTLGQGSDGNLYRLSGPVVTNLGSIGGSGAQPMTTTRIQNPDDPHFASGLTDCIVICTGVGGPYVYDGVNLYTPAGWSAAANAQWVASVNGITWFGGISATPNQIFGTGDGIIDSMETLPGYRNFVFSASVTGLCAQGTGATGTLVIGRAQGLSVLSGTGVSTFFLQDVPFADGVIAGRTMISANGTIYFLGRNAFYAFDGQTEPKRTSDKVEPYILNSPFVIGYPMTRNRNLSWACAYNNKIHLGYCSVAATPDTILCLDLLVGGWTILQTTPGLMSMTLLDAPIDPSPFEAVVGSSLSGQTYQWDAVPATTSSAALDGSVPVAARVVSKYFWIGDPGTNKALMRTYPELFISGPFAASFILGVDAGNVLVEEVINSLDYENNLLTWNVGTWNQQNWGGVNGFLWFGAPNTRLDWPGTQGDTFGFGMASSTPNSPWIFAGCTAVFQQRGKT
jgi:hypothetical protein